ncbi:MAG: hypothetical protein KDB07_02005 [Planctomycetes bacterium]|nr:hypothetical protein [Planctomycetota bacterium]
MLTIGGVLMFWGYMLYSGSSTLNAGYEALRQERYSDAYLAFDDDVKDNRERLESWAGKGLALLGLDRGLDAEEVYAHIHETLEDNRTPAPRVRIWRDRNPRDWGRSKGYFLYFDAWMHLERILRAYRNGRPIDYIQELNALFGKQRQEFEDYVNEAEENRSEPGYWAKRLGDLDQRLAKGDKVDALERAKKQLKDSSRLGENSGEQLESALVPILERAVKEAPENITIRAWHVLICAELARRDLKLADGRVARELLKASYVEGVKLEKMRSDALASEEPSGTWLALGPIETARFQLALLRAASLLPRYDRANTERYRTERVAIGQRLEVEMDKVVAMKSSFAENAKDQILALHAEVILELQDAAD